MMNKKQVIFATLTIFIIMITFTSIARATLSASYRLFAKGFFLPVIPLAPRGSDSFGSGKFGASRDSGRRKHMGQDYLTPVPNQPVFSPIGGLVTISTAYADGRFPELKMIKINDGIGTTVNLMYVSPDIEGGTTVMAGEHIGFAQSLQRRYPGIPNHIHVEVSVGGIKVDPAPFFVNLKNNA